ncbi:MAG TPA: type I-MYXAN CRISPR-associated protein Cas6/Cmx6 [Blastocatellia bacterium]|nr:type I-MYXAN CRISPR-associated protein Cas6/Cmx6 [Blastocatellia bacterium]
MVYVELRFPLLGATPPRADGRAMFRAISRLVPETANAGWLLVSARRSSGALACAPQVHLRMRLPQSRVSRMLELAHRWLQIGGQPVRLGTPGISLLKPCASLYARCVVINGCSRPEAFLDALCWRLDEMGIACEIELGRRERFRAGRRRVVGFALTLHDLSEDDSIALQEQGLGNHRHLGCGFFVPALKKSVRTSR